MRLVDVHVKKSVVERRTAVVAGPIRAVALMRVGQTVAAKSEDFASGLPLVRRHSEDDRTGVELVCLVTLRTLSVDAQSARILCVRQGVVQEGVMKTRKADRALEAVVLGAGILAELFPLQALRADELGLAKLFSLQAAHSDELEATGEMVSFGALRAPQKLGLGHESDGVETVPEEHSVAVKKLVMIRGIADSALR